VLKDASEVLQSWGATHGQGRETELLSKVQARYGTRNKARSSIAAVYDEHNPPPARTTEKERLAHKAAMDKFVEGAIRKWEMKGGSSRDGWTALVAKVRARYEGKRQELPPDHATAKGFCAAHASARQQALGQELEEWRAWAPALRMLSPARSPRAMSCASEREALHGSTPLHIATELSAHAFSGHLELGLLRFMRSLLQCWPAAAEQRDDDGWLPLHSAASCGAPMPVVELLLRANSRGLRAREIAGSLPLHIAVSPTSKATVQLVQVVKP